MLCQAKVGTAETPCETEAGEEALCAAHMLQEGDLVTMPPIVGIHPDGGFMVDETASPEELAQWKVGHRRHNGSWTVDLLPRQG